MARLSIIIPVYNTEKYLEESIYSISGQSFSDMEIICMDDGSTDASARILDELSLKDDRIKVVHKTNSGYGDTINQGIDLAVGDYIGIVEPDDYIAPNMYEDLVGAVDMYELDFAKGNFAYFSGEDNNKVFTPLKVLGDHELYSKVLCPLEHEAIFRGYIMNPSGIYRRSFLNENKIRHNVTPGASFQDTGFWFQIMIYAKRAMFIDKDYYFYRQDNACSSMNDRKKIYCICDEYTLLKERIRNNGINSLVSGYLSLCMFEGYWNTLGRMAASYKEGFIDRFAEDFSALKNEGLFEDSSFTMSEKGIVEMIIENKGAFVEKCLRAADWYKENLRDYNKVIVYGAGKYGKKVLNDLYESELNKIIGIAVSSKEGQPERVFDIKVESIENYLSYRDEAAVVVGVSSQYADEVRYVLQKHGFKNIINIVE